MHNSSYLQYSAKLFRNGMVQTFKHFLMIPSAIGRSHLTRLVLIALQLKHRAAEVAFAFKENSQILEDYDSQVFRVLDAVFTDFSGNIFAALH